MKYFSDFLRMAQPSLLAGYTLSAWFSVLRKNKWAVDFPYVPRALTATVGACCTSVLKIFENRIRLEPIDRDAFEQPLFILGLGRSGTTHLYNLLTRCPNFCFATRFDCYNPHTFLTLRRLGVDHFLARFPAKKRSMDNVTTGWLSPEETQLALFVLAANGTYLNRAFPRECWRLRESLRAEGATPEERRAFRAALAEFCRKLVFLHQRCPILKSPGLTSSIPEILEVFPRARFLTILRTPYAQYASARAMHSEGAQHVYNLQRPVSFTDDDLLRKVQLAIGRYLDTRLLVPKGRMLEIRYEHLVSDEERCLQTVYNWLGVAPTSVPRSERAVAYENNKHAELPKAIKCSLQKIYRPAVEAGLFQQEELASM